MQREGLRIVGGALVVAGLFQFASGVHALHSGPATAVLTIAALIVLIYLTWTVDPAWILSAALASTMFSGHWEKLGLNASVGPNRVLLVAGVLAVLLRAPPARD